MIESEENTIDKYLVRPSRRRKPDMSASFVTPQGDKKVWSEYFSVWLIKEGYLKGKDKDGNTIIVQTRSAKDVITGQQDTPSNKRRPDLFIRKRPTPPSKPYQSNPLSSRVFMGVTDVNICTAAKTYRSLAVEWIVASRLLSSA